MENILTTFIGNIINSNYYGIKENEKNLFEIRKIIFKHNENNSSNNNNNKNDNSKISNNKCFICHKYCTNLKLRQVETSTRVTDEIISSHLICDHCFIKPILD